MAGTKRVDCHVEVDPQCRLGVYANAFRIAEGDGEERILDFFLYSEAEQTAQLVSRVRVHLQMLPGIQEQLGQVMQDLSDQRYDGLRVIGDTTVLN